MAKNRLILIDGHSVVFRAFYAIPYLTDPDGEQVNAVYGFALILLNVINDLEPTHIAVTFDTSKPTFRHVHFDRYKAQRKETPVELKDQMEKVHEVVRALNIPVFEVDGYEADDVIGTLAKQASITNNKAPITKKVGSPTETIIVTGDQDQFQLIRDGLVKVWVPGRGKKAAVMYGEDEVVGKLGVRPEQVPDYKGLAGDSSDNIPGVRGIGPTTTVKILREFESIEEMYEVLEKEEADDREERLKRAGISGSVLTKLTAGKEMAEKSKMLATIIRDVPINLDLAACKVSGYDKNEVIELFDKLGFKSLMNKLPADEFELSVQDSLF